jgi:DNA mismatch repair protein MSH4
MYAEKYNIQAETRYEPARKYYLRISENSFDDQVMPNELVNCFRKKRFIECQTLEMMKLNQRIQDSHQEVVMMSDKTIRELLDDIRGEIPTLYRVCESIALLDVLAAFAQIATNYDYARPELTAYMAIRAGRHPVCEKVKSSITFLIYLSSTYVVIYSRRTQRSSSQTMCTQQNRLDFKLSPGAI